MATSCPGPGRCGTVAPVWLDISTMVNLTSNTYSVDACVSWGFGDGGFDNFDCCLFTLPVKMKQCSGFKVYYLGPTQACDIAYCSAPVNSPASVSPKKFEKGLNFFHTSYKFFDKHKKNNKYEFLFRKHSGKFNVSAFYQIN